MKRRLALVSAVSVMAVAAGVAAGGASGAAPTVWFWTPGVCKSYLHRYGVRIDDGRTFHVARAYCVGSGGEQTCQWSSSHRKRLFTTFFAVARSPDGVVRNFQLRPTGSFTFRLRGIRAVERLSATAFERKYATAVRSLALAENARGCGPYTP